MSAYSHEVKSKLMDKNRNEDEDVLGFASFLYFPCKNVQISLKLDT